MALKISLQELQDNLFSCSIWLGYENYDFKITNQEKSFDFERDFGNLKKKIHFNVDLTQGITKYIIKIWCLVSNSSCDEKMFFMNNMWPRIDS